MESKTPRSYRWGEHPGHPIYAKYNHAPCGGGMHFHEWFVPLCFICCCAIGRTVQDGKWKVDENNEIQISELEVAWTQRYRAIIFDRNRKIVLSEVGNIIYHGPYLELLQLPVKDEQISEPKVVEFFPLCYHPNGAEEYHDTFGCTVHAACWDLLEHVLGRKVPNNQLAKITQVLREQMHPNLSLSIKPKKFFPDPMDPYEYDGVVQDWSEQIVPYLCDPINIPELNDIYSLCQKTEGDYIIQDRGYYVLNRLYTALPWEVKFMIAEYLENRKLAPSFDIGHTLPEYWQKKLLRRYGQALIEVNRFRPGDIDWQNLYYRVKVLDILGDCHGWKNRRRILNALWGTRLRYLIKERVEPSPEELMICYERDTIHYGTPKKRRKLPKTARHN